MADRKEEQTQTRISDWVCAYYPSIEYLQIELKGVLFSILSDGIIMRQTFRFIKNIELRSQTNFFFIKKNPFCWQKMKSQL